MGHARKANTSRCVFISSQISTNISFFLSLCSRMALLEPNAIGLIMWEHKCLYGSPFFGGILSVADNVSNSPQQLPFQRGTFPNIYVAVQKNSNTSKLFSLTFQKSANFYLNNLEENITTDLQSSLNTHRGKLNFISCFMSFFSRY